MNDKLELLVRRAAAKLISDYTPPALGCSEELFEELQAATRLGPQGSEWAAFAAEISNALRASGTDQFLRLPPIAKTLHSRQRSHTRRYLSYLLGSKRFSPTIHKALTESPVGKPLVNPHYPLSSPLLVQHGYHLTRLLESTDFDLSRLRLVVEFGGGYGSFFRLLRNLGYRDRYLICDLPVMCALQRFYLRNVFPTDPGAQPPANLQWLSGDEYGALEREAAQHNPSLFIATWSLSETPLAVRSQVASVMGGFSYILCAYQRTFGSYDNVEYFTSLQKTLPQFTWQHAECPVYRNNFYLIGQNTAAAQVR
jgi:putative sugar O-methyltransferase